MKKLLIITTLAAAFTHATLAQPKDLSLQVKEIETPTISNGLFQQISISNPVVITEAESASQYLTGAQLNTVQSLDFTKKKVLAFFWLGSGKDKLTFSISEKSPKHATFTRHLGRTKDSVKRMKVFILEKDMTYQISNFRKPEQSN